jgi:hypothetical protein
VIDSATNKVVQTISGIEVPHGVIFLPTVSGTSAMSLSARDVVDEDREDRQANSPQRPSE